MDKKNDDYVVELEALLSKYSKLQVAKMLGKQERSVYNYLNDNRPSKATLKLIHESFRKYVTEGKDFDVEDVPATYVPDALSALLEQQVQSLAISRVILSIQAEFIANQQQRSVNVVLSEVKKLVDQEVARIFAGLEQK